MNTIYILDFLPSFPLPDKWMQMKKHLKSLFFQINKQQTEEIDLYFHTAISVKGCKWVRGKVHTHWWFCVVNEALISQIMYDEVIVTSCMDSLKNATFRSKYECVVKAEVRSPRSRS